MPDLTASTILETAEAIARAAHDGHERKDGAPYTTHLEKVVAQLASDDLRVVGWLHDVLEDTPVSAQELIAQGIPEELVSEIVLLTKKREQPYSDYISSLKSSFVARTVKKADIVANLSDNPGNKQTIKMCKALITLCQD